MVDKKVVKKRVVKKPVKKISKKIPKVTTRISLGDDKNTLRQLDRIALSYGQKIQVKQYEPVEVTAFYSSDVNIGETVEEAFERITAVVSKKIRIELEAIMKIKNANN